VALDCANGSASRTAETLFTQLGADVHVLHASPTGLNINKNCGSTHMDSLRRFMLDNHCNVAFAFDGDADRCLALDENGELVDGDQLMAICANDLKQRGRLNENTLVATVMSNFGMHSFAREQDINLVCTTVGDRYVLEEMLKYGYVIGGEQSGHIIFKEFAQTGDGQLTAVQVLSILKRSGKKMSELASVMKKAPQVLKGVEIAQDGKKLLATNGTIKKKISEVQAALGETGRVLVRASGTEPLIRVMVEGDDTALIERCCDEVCAVIEAEKEV
ncbi:MAG: phosphoglucosamine mutase, partial [Massilimaliae sp.]|nr:phosphoglucosamine mutase [Massiliimalia sp.]